MSNCATCEKKEVKKDPCECICTDSCGDRSIVTDFFKRKVHSDYISIERRFTQPNDCNELVAKCQKASVSKDTFDSYVKSLLGEGGISDVIINDSKGETIVKKTGKGVITFTLPSNAAPSEPKKQYFMAAHYANADITIDPTKLSSDLIFNDQEQGDNGDGYGYTASTGVFKAEYNGLYSFSFNANISFADSQASKSVKVMIFKQSITNARVEIYHSNKNVTDDNISASAQIRLNKDDLVTVRVLNTNTNHTTKILLKNGEETPYFHGHLIYELDAQETGPLG